MSPTADTASEDQSGQALTVPDLIALLGPDLTRLVDSCINDEYANERRLLVNRARRNWRFIKGDQFLAPSWIDQGEEEYADWVSVDGSSAENGAAQKFCYPVNVLAADLWKFDAVMGQSAPNVKAVPDDVDDQESIDAAAKADVSFIDFKSKWEADQKQHELAFHQFVTGPIFGLTRYVTNKRKYGTTQVPKISMDPDTGLPVPGGMETYDNGDVDLELFSILEVSVPFGKKTLEDCGWLHLEYLKDKNLLLSLYRDQLQENRDQDGATSSDRNAATSTALQAQEATAIPSGVGKIAKKGHWLLQETWLDFEQFEGIYDKEKRQIAQQHFPSGLYAVKVNDKWVNLEDEYKGDVWGVVKTGRGPYILENPICHDVIPFQKALNDLFGLALETSLRAIPRTLVDQALMDRKSAAENDAIPGEIVFTMASGNGDISKGIAELPVAKFSDQLVPFLTLWRSTMQDVDGIRPELSGGGQPTSTFREAKQRKDQAMMTLSTPNEEQSRGWEVFYSNGTRQRAKYATGQIKVTQNNGFGVTSKAIDAEDLTEGKWHCEADDGIPMSFTERADRVLGLLKEYPPEVLQQLCLTDIVNINQILHLLQLTGFKSPVEEQYKSVLKTIGQLAQEQPIPSTNPDGSPGDPTPSVPLDEIMDDPAFNFKVCQAWLRADEGKALQQDKPDGYANVKAYASACKTAANPPAPPPPPLDVKGSVAIKFETLPPDIQSTLLQDFKLLPPGSPPLAIPAPPPVVAGPQPPGPVSQPPEAQESPMPPQPIDSGNAAPPTQIQ